MSPISECDYCHEVILAPTIESLKVKERVHYKRSFAWNQDIGIYYHYCDSYTIIDPTNVEKKHVIWGGEFKKV